VLETAILGIVIFIVTFWIVIFAVLPFGFEPQDVFIKGAVPSAPKKINFRAKFLLTALISFIITVLILIFGNQGLESLAKIEWEF
jgi:predicted secreted protein